MIYTITFNPSLDYVVHTTDFSTGNINRAEAEAIYPGGKGINVSLVLQALGTRSKALGFVAGFTGREIERLCVNAGVQCDFLYLREGNSRINVKVISHEETALNGIGPLIGQEDINHLKKTIGSLSSDDVLVLAGSIPAGIDNRIYEQLLASVATKGVRTVVDATGDLLRNVLKYKPFLIKPNREELEELFDIKRRTDEDIIFQARKLQEEGAQNVLVSLGGDGAVLIGEDNEIYKVKTPEGTLVNSVGAGDSMVAGFISAYMKYGGNLSEALRWGIAAGSATAFHEWLATGRQIKDMYEAVWI